MNMYYLSEQVSFKKKIQFNFYLANKVIFLNYNKSSKYIIII